MDHKAYISKGPGPKIATIVFPGCWFQSTHLEKIWVKFGIISPGFGVKISKKYVSCHQPVSHRPPNNRCWKLSIRTPTFFRQAKLQDADAQEMQWQTSKQNMLQFFF